MVVIGERQTFAARAVETGKELQAAQIISIIDVAAVRRGKARSRGHDLRCYPVQGVVIEGEDRPVALAQRCPTARNVVAIFFIVGVGRYAGGRLRRKMPSLQPIMAVIQIGRASCREKVWQDGSISV